MGINGDRRARIPCGEARRIAGSLQDVTKMKTKMMIRSFWVGLLGLALLCTALTVQLAGRDKLAPDHAPTSGGAKFDGPAELPRVYVKSAMSDTPAPGKTLVVKTTGDLQQALEAAKCGDTVQLQPGTTFTGKFTLPAKSCDDSHWIIIRTGAPDNALPQEHTRITPCFAGVPSLPGRPSFHCSTAKNVMAKLEFQGEGSSGPLFLDEGANHYRLLGLEITRSAGGRPISDLVQPRQPTATANHIIFDRVWIHGTARDETARGILLTGTNYAVVDSFFSDFHCTAVSGSCIDSQAIVGGVGVGPMGPYKIVNNFLEAAGENVIFGGARATATPTDIEIRHNYLFKPLAWMAGQPDFVGATDGNPFIVKNHFELKNAQRVLFEGNVLEDSWGGFSQPGASILLTPKNQAGGQGKSLCPTCQVTDVTIRYCRVSHVAGGLQVGNGRSDNGAAPQAGERYSIHDVVFDDIDASTYKGYGYLALIFTAFSGQVPLLQHVRFDHITAFPSTQVLNIGGPISPKMSDFTFTNSIVYAGDAPIPFTSTGGGPTNCAAQARDPEKMLENCFSSYVFSNNAIVRAQPVSWPHSNFLLPDASAVQFAKYGGGKNGDYRLLSTSRYKKAGLDSKDLGADMDALNAAIAGVVD